MTTQAEVPAAAVSPTERLAYKPSEFAAATGISRARVFELLKTGELGSVKYGRTRLIPREAVIRFLKVDESSLTAMSSHRLTPRIAGLVLIEPAGNGAATLVSLRTPGRAPDGRYFGQLADAREWALERSERLGFLLVDLIDARATAE